MQTFVYHEPTQLDEAFALLDTHGDDAQLLAGGTALVLLMRLGLALPGHVIGLRKIGGMREIGILADGGLEIGALVTHAEIERSALVERFFAPLARTFGAVATVRIRNQATIGGNLAHADPASDPPPMLMALDAQIVVASHGAIRTIAAADFFAGIFETVLQPGEIITAIRIPPPAAGTRGAYVKFLPASKDDFATISVAAVVRTARDGTCEHARIALGAAAAMPVRARRAEELLVGRAFSFDAIREAATVVGDEIDPLDDARGSAAYKRKVARVWARRALEELAQR